MPATTGYQAGYETSGTQLSYGVESVWGTKPATTFQAIRYTGESLSGSKNRDRPNEINATREVSAAVTTKEGAGGAINFALSYGTYDDFLSVLLGNDWGAAVVIAGIAADVTITNVSATQATLSSTLGTKYSNIVQGQWIRLLGFTNAGNNNIMKVAVKVSNSSLTLTTPFAASVTETPAAALAQVRGGTLANGVQFKSLFIQQKFAPTVWLNYAGAFIASGTLSGGVGQFLSGTFNTLAASEVSAVLDQSTGGILPAPTGRVHDPAGSFVGVLWADALVAAKVDSFSLQISNDGAALEYALGAAAGVGVMAGTLSVSGSLKLFFRDFVQYALYKAETSGNLSIVTKDPSGNAYVITLPSAFLMNPKIEAGGPGQAVYAAFDIEGSPGGMVQIDRLPST